MRYLGQAAFFLTFLAAGLAFVLSARRGWGPGRLLGESWPLMVLVAVLVLISMGAGWIFVRLARPVIDQLLDELPGEHPFYIWEEGADSARWMCSWDTTESDVDALLAAVRSAVG